MYCNNNRLSLVSQFRFTLRVSSLFMRSYQQTNFKIKTVLTDPYGRKSDRKNKERNREYYTVARRYEFYVRVARTILPREHKIHIFELTCNILFII